MKWITLSHNYCLHTSSQLSFLDRFFLVKQLSLLLHFWQVKVYGLSLLYSGSLSLGLCWLTQHGFYLGNHYSKKRNGGIQRIKSINDFFARLSASLVSDHFYHFCLLNSCMVRVYSLSCTYLFAKFTCGSLSYLIQSEPSCG